MDLVAAYTNSNAQVEPVKKELLLLIDRVVGGDNSSTSFVSAYDCVYKLSLMKERDFLIDILKTSIYKIIRLQDKQLHKQLLKSLQDIYLYASATWFAAYNICFEEIVTEFTQQIAMFHLSLATPRSVHK